MSITRWGCDGSEVYVYNDAGRGLVCASCCMLGGTTFVAGSLAAGMIGHLQEHRDRGDSVPEYAFERLRRPDWWRPDCVPAGGEIWSYCEPSVAGPLAPWCIRRLTEAGRKLGGGIDTPSLCGRVKPPYGWDIPVPVDVIEAFMRSRPPVCKRCLDEMVQR